MRHSLQNAQQFIIDYLDEVCHTGISNGLGVKHDPARLRLLLCSIARNTATEASLEMLRKDVLNQLTHKGNALEATETVARYLDSLERLMIYEPLPSWMPHLRSSARLRKKPTLHFVDPALAVGALRATPDDLKSDLKYLGFLFESLVIRDLRVYAQPLRGDVSHYRDSYGLEVDAIVEIDATKWCAIEIKLSSRSEVIDAAARNLLRFAAQLDYTNREKPRELVVITGSGYGYRRKDGVIVMPFGALYA